MNILYSLQHLGYTIPPQADAGWIGEAGPGPSYLDPGSGGPQNDFTNRNTTFATWNLMHLAKLLKAADRMGLAAIPTTPGGCPAASASEDGGDPGIRGVAGHLRAVDVVVAQGGDRRAAQPGNASVLPGDHPLALGVWGVVRHRRGCVTRRSGGGGRGAGRARRRPG
jgi:hypothetical protein